MKPDRPSGQQIKNWRKLRQKKYRRDLGLFLAEGERCVEQILHNRRIAVEAVLRSGSSGWTPDHAACPFYELDERDFQAVADTKNPQGVAAVCRIPPDISVDRMKTGKGLMIAVDGIRDPGNLGTIIRTAVWFGAGGLLCGNGSVDPYHPKVVRSTAGATGALPVAGGELHPMLSLLEEQGWQVFLLQDGEESAVLEEAGKTDRVILVVGNEANGVNQALFTGNRKRVCIRGQSETVESLNAAVALSIALYEMRRV